MPPEWAPHRSDDPTPDLVGSLLRNKSFLWLGGPTLSTSVQPSSVGDCPYQFPEPYTSARGVTKHAHFRPCASETLHVTDTSNPRRVTRSVGDVGAQAIVGSLTVDARHIGLPFIE